jgi:hypothetical protein
MVGYAGRLHGRPELPQHVHTGPPISSPADSRPFVERRDPLDERPMVPLLVEDNEQTLTHREALRRWPAGPVDRLGVGREGLGGQAVDHRAHGRHPVAAQRQHLVE